MGINQGDHLKPSISPSLPKESHPNIEPPRLFSEKITSLGSKIKSIFDHRKQQNPTETFQQLASLEIPSEDPVLPPDVKSNPDEPIVKPLDHFEPIISPQDQAEITQLTQDIKKNTPENQSILESTTEAPKPPERTLFPDRPSLDELITQDPNKKTKASFITRQKDIYDLKKSGVSDASQVYDNLIKKGVPRGLILETKGKVVDYGQYGLYMKHYASYEDELKTKEGQKNRKSDIQQLKKTAFIHDTEKFYDSLRARGLSRDQTTEALSPNKRIYQWRQLPEIMDKLHSINLLDRVINIECQEDPLVYNLSLLPDEDFQKRREEIKPLFFLKPDDLPKLFSPSINQEPNPFINWFSQNFLSENNQEDSFSEIICQNIKTVLLSDSWEMDSAIKKCLETIILSDLNQNQTITIPDIFDQDKKSWEASNIQILNQIEDRRQQKFFIKNPDKHNFNKEGVPLVRFYTSFVGSSDFSGEAITIPEKTLLVDSNQNKALYQNISNLKNPNFQKTCLQFANSNFFDSNGNLTPLFFISHLTYRKDTFVTDADISNFSEKEKSPIKLIRNIKNLLDSVKYSGLNNFLFSQTDINQYCNPDGQPNASFFKSAFSCLQDIKEYQAFFELLTPDRLSSFSETDKKLWEDIISVTSNISEPVFLKNIISTIIDNNQNLVFFNQDHQPTSLFFEKLVYLDILGANRFNSIFSLITPEIFNQFNEVDKKAWQRILSLNGSNFSATRLILSTKNSDSTISFLFSQDNKPTSSFFDQIYKSSPYLDIDFFKNNLTIENINSFPKEEQRIWRKIKDILESSFQDRESLISSIFYRKNLINEYLDDKDQFTQKFYLDYIQTYPENFVRFHNRQAWTLTFGQETISKLLNFLPISTDEKRNAFTHNQYDRTSEFFTFLINHSVQTNFKLDTDHLKIASEYIQKYGLSKSSEFYSYFQSLYLYEQDKFHTLPDELISHNITSIESLDRSINAVQKLCFSINPILDTSQLTSFELNLLSIITGNSSNTFTRIPIERIVSDFSRDLSEGQINPLPPEFHPETMILELINVETDKKISDSSKLTSLRQEILAATDSYNDISTETNIIFELFNQRIRVLSKGTQESGSTKKQEFIQKQIDTFKQKINDLSAVKSIDELLSHLITLNLNLGEDQDKFNAILRQLVFKKVFDKHKNTPDLREGIVASLKNDSSTVDAVSNMLDLINNIIKDHVLNFEANNQDGYWSHSAFEAVKKYSSVFKKNLNFTSFISELSSFQESFKITNLSQNQTIQIIPDRGLIGEMSGYMANVCYTKVYPLLKQYPNLVPYKFVSSPESKNPEFIGSTLVFQIQDANNQPVFLIRAFDIPKDQSIDIGKLFESFIEHLTPIAKKIGIKKILAAGTPGTISNYGETTKYVLSNYVTGKTPTELKEKFDFNDYDITEECYLVRNL